MPYPTGNESFKHFSHKFMSSPEAIKSFPDIKRRAAVMYSLWKHRKSKAKIVVSNSDNNGDETLYGCSDNNTWQDDMKEMLKNGDVAIT